MAAKELHAPLQFLRGFPPVLDWPHKQHNRQLYLANHTRDQRFQGLCVRENGKFFPYSQNLFQQPFLERMN